MPKVPSDSVTDARDRAVSGMGADKMPMVMLIQVELGGLKYKEKKTVYFPGTSV